MPVNRDNEGNGRTDPAKIPGRATPGPKAPDLPSGHRAGPPLAPGSSTDRPKESARSPLATSPGVGKQTPSNSLPPNPTDLAPSISLPKGGGALKNIGEKFEANAFTGSGGMSIPIAVSPARDLSPSLALGYSTGAGNGPFGMGWQLSVPAISRKTDRGLPTYDDAREGDVFLISDAEDLVPLLDQDGDDWTPRIYEQDGYRVHAYRPRVEAGFAKIERWVKLDTGDVHWRTWTRANVRSTYGFNPDNRITSPEDAARIFSWLIDETRDDRGNIVVFEYKAEDLDNVDVTALEEHERLAVTSTQTQRYLKRILYGNAAPGVAENWRFEVLLDYGEHDEYGEVAQSWLARADTFSSFRPGFDLRTRRLCRRIFMFHHIAALSEDPRLVSATELTYDENPVAAFLTSAQHHGYDYIDDAYVKKSYPAVAFTYSAAEVDTTVHFVERDSLENLPGAVAGGRFDLVDLDGEGLPGMLIEHAGAWYYKRNEGEARFGAVRRLPSAPHPMPFGAQRLLDLDGDGQLSVVSFAGPARGYFDRARTHCGATAEDWEAFRSFRTLPDIDLDAANVQFIDLDGDGFADILVAEDSRFVWYPSLGKEGFGEPRVLSRPRDERAGPQLVWSDPRQAIYYSDMTGDGLSDIVRVRNGSVDYWPNLGYGRFGRQIGMRGAPVFDRPDRFRTDRVRLGDIDGSGTTDIVYVREDGARTWRNQAGNSFSAVVHLDGFPPVDSLASVELTDLLGKGTAALVWSTDLPHRQGTHVAYMDLMAAGKPYLMLSAVNNMGGETRVSYAPSTKYYLEDRAAGRPWKTRLPFPTHVIDRVEVRDHVTGHTFVQKYRYRHGYFDGPEREFRGFGMVEVEDTESWADYNAPKLFPTGHEIVDEELHSPPVRTRTWFHTGAYLGGTSLSRCYADEYYSDRTVENPDGIAVDLADTLIPDGLTPIERREAVRALRGRALRVEVYGLDGSEKAAHPYSVAETDFAVRLLQPKADQRHAAFFVHDREALSYHYERDPADPRVSHAVTLAVDEFGNVLKSASIGYPRPVSLGAPDEQTQTSVVYTEVSVTNVADDPDSYRLGVPIESRTYEIGALEGDPTEPFTASFLLTYIDNADEVPYETTAGTDEKRLLSRVQQYYYTDDLTGPLTLGSIGLRALPYETLALAFTKAQLSHPDVLDTKLTGIDLDTEGGYREEDTFWWRPSGRVVFDPDLFFRIIEVHDILGNVTTLNYDADGLLLESAVDPLDNTVTAENDYRVLAPVLVTDPNGNRQAFAFDPLGMVVKTAVMGKEADDDGDTLEDPTVEFEYQLDQWAEEEPVYVHTKARETHGPGALTFQESYTYSGGLGQVVLQKVQAEPGLAPKRNIDGELVFIDDELQYEEASHRWVGNGRTVLDNKGNPVKQYEPFFDSSPVYTDEQELVEWGVTPFLHYDPLGRLIRTDLPDGTFTTIAFTPWEQTIHDANDNVLASDWWAERDALMEGTPENDGEIFAKEKCESHDSTPTRVLFDNLGRPFKTIADNGLDEDDQPLLYETHVTLDIEGNPLVVTDALGIATETDTFAPGGLQLRTRSPDAGDRWALPNALGNPLRHWDSRDHVRRWTYDELNRPTHAYIKHASDDEKLQTRTLYGESLGVTAPVNNHLGKVYRVYDSAGVLTSVAYDFKGNQLESERRLAEDYTTAPDWIDLAAETDPATIETAADSLLEAEAFTTSWTFDALNRPVTQTTPDSSLTAQVFGAGGLLQSVAVNIRGAVDPTDIVTNIDYNARGQRTRIDYGNDSWTEYEYDPKTFRVRRIHTERPNDDPDLRNVQDLHYHYDPSGNIAMIRDEAQQGVFFDNAYVDATQKFYYDPTYRLIKARGRELASLTLPSNQGFISIPHPQSGTNTQRRYKEEYTYDAVGNITSLVHTSGGLDKWKRGYDYHPTDDHPQLQQISNRLRATSRASDVFEEPWNYLDKYEYDEHGNMTSMPSLTELTWDDDDRLQAALHGDGGHTYYVYDGAGQRVRKVRVNLAETTSKERLYFGPWETYRERHNIDTTPVLDLERETLHVHDDTGRVCLIETKTVDDGGPVVDPANIARYQYSNHLGTATLELDSDGDVITYEEFHPYGTSSYSAANEAIEVSSKRYHYTGKERDEETGLGYHGLRYYASWIARWSAADPVGIGDGSNRYSYVSGNPISLRDPSGTRAQAEPGRQSELKAIQDDITTRVEAGQLSQAEASEEFVRRAGPGRTLPEKKEESSGYASAGSGAEPIERQYLGPESTPGDAPSRGSSSPSGVFDRLFALSAVLTGEKIAFGADKTTVGASWGKGSGDVPAPLVLGALLAREALLGAAVGLIGKAAWLLRKLGGNRFASKLDEFAERFKSSAPSSPAEPAAPSAAPSIALRTGVASKLIGVPSAPLERAIRRIQGINVGGRRIINGAEAFGSRAGSIHRGRGPSADSDLDVLLDAPGYRFLGPKQKKHVQKRLEQIETDFKTEAGFELDLRGLKNRQSVFDEVSENTPFIRLF